MPDVLAEPQSFLADFERLEREAGPAAPPWLRRLRKTAIARFAELGLPTPRNEDWKFTNLAPLARVPFRLAGPADDGADALRPYAFARAVQLIFVNGRHTPALGATGGLPRGVTVGGLADALRDRPADLEPHLGRLARHDEDPFTALNTAFARDGAYVALADGVALDRPVHLVYVSTAAAEPTASHPRTLVVAGRDSRLTLVETYVGADGVYFTNAVTEVAAGPGAVIDHYKVQQEGPDAFHVGVVQVHQAEGSTFSSHYVGLGGALVRHEGRVLLGGPRCEATLNGLYLANGRQHMDNHTVIDHAQPHCASHELYKGILAGKARGVFNGKIFVRQDAQKTDAKQTNQTLLLSDDATINTKPQLEIFADDVKCTHGATVGQLDPDALFYLRARGIGLEAARALLTYAFANDVLRRIRVEPVRARLETLLLAAGRLPADAASGEAV